MVDWLDLETARNPTPINCRSLNLLYLSWLENPTHNRKAVSSNLTGRTEGVVIFFCEPCRKARGWPESMSRSSGNCEVCDSYAVCFDVPSYQLPLPQAVLTEAEVVRGSAWYGYIK